MRIARHAVVASVLAAAFGAVAACSTDAGVDAAPPAEAGSTPPTDSSDDHTAIPEKDAPSDVGPDAPDFPVGKGNPCRGTALPLDQHYVPKGMCARMVASGLQN